MKESMHSDEILQMFPMWVKIPPASVAGTVSFVFLFLSTVK